MHISIAALCLVVVADVIVAADTGASNLGVTVRPLAGEAIKGKIVKLSEQQVIVAGSPDEQTFAASDLLAIDFAPAKVADKPTVWVDLLDGSKLLAIGYEVSAGKASVRLVGGATVEVPTRSIHAVRFRQQDGDLAQAWREIVSAEHTSDLIVVRKTSTRTVDEGGGEPKTITETALDELDGTVLDIGAESVKFDFDGDKIDVKREKVEGIVYYHAAGRELAAGVCRLVDAGGSQWSLRSLELSKESIALVTPAGVSASLPLTTLVKIDFSVGNIVALPELAPDTGDGEPVVSLQPKAMAAPFGRMFKVSASPPLGADGFKIGGKRYESGLSLHSPARLVYRVPAGFRKFHAIAGVDDSVVAPGDFTLQILGDGKELLRHEFQGQQERGPLAIDLDLAGVRRLSIVIDPADGQDIGDQLNLCEARLTR
jgi:hypothetical protein